MTERVRLSRKRGFKLPANTVVVSRPSKWGNRFRLEGGATPRDVVGAYEQWLRHTTPGRELLAQARAELRGKNLACWCPLGSPCHADVLLAILEVVPELEVRP